MYQAKQPCDAYASNLLTRARTESGCCTDSVTPCKYTVTFPVASTATGITLTNCDGDSQALTLSANIPGSAGGLALSRALNDLILSAGFITDGTTSFGYDVVGTDIVLWFISESAIASVQRTSGGDLSATAACTFVGRRCTYYLSWEGDADAFFVVTDPEGNEVSTGLGSLTPAGNTAANVVSALDPLLPDNSSVSVYENATPTPDTFEISIFAPDNYTFAIGAETEEIAFAKSNCHPDYTA